MSKVMVKKVDQFRSEVREWIIANCPDEMRDGDTSLEGICWGGSLWEFTSAAQSLWLQRCVDIGWTVPTWPKEFGGAGLTDDQGKVVEEEMLALGARLPLYNMGIVMLGPVLLKYGTQAQKLTHLPKIASGVVRWCQGYSEPNAGSDLASLSTKCEDIGESWLVNGQKTWTSSADKADWIFALVRTDSSGSKHQGISFLLLPVDSAGTTVRPIELISGKSKFCEVFFEDVSVPKSYGDDNPSMVGNVGEGWEVATYLLKFERGGLAGLREKDVDLIGLATEEFGLDANGRLDSSVFRSDLVEFLIEDMAFRAAGESLEKEKYAGGNNAVKSSVLKYAGTKIIQREFELRMDLEGANALELKDVKNDWGELSQKWLYSRAYTIFGGTSEIQLNILAKRILELPSK